MFIFMTKLKHFSICLFALLFVLVFSGCGDEDETVVVPSNGQEQQNPNNNEGSENPDKDEPSNGQEQQNPNNNEGSENPDNGEPSDGQGQQNSNNKGPENPENLTFTETVNGVSFKMVAVEGGSFQMGGTEEQSGDPDIDEFPVHQVTLSGYSIGQTEVTQALWVAVMGSNPSFFQGDDLPVEQVSWNDIQEFLQKLNQMTGLNYRLPSEAEWEYAARGGNKSQGYKYSGSNNVDDVAWYTSNSHDNGTTKVGSFAPNELGIYDMSGNVFEWCQDWYGDYSSSSQSNPTGPATGSRRVLRGGSWVNYAWFCRVSYRGYYNPGIRYGHFGFRLAL